MAPIRTENGEFKIFVNGVTHYTGHRRVAEKLLKAKQAEEQHKDKERMRELLRIAGYLEIRLGSGKKSDD